MKLKIYNTLTRQKEDFVPLMDDPSYIWPKKDFVWIYSCGPTVYSTPHIGNFRAYVFSDILKCTIKYVLWYKVKHIINITDVWHLVDDSDDWEDKMEKWAKREWLTAFQVAQKYEKEFVENMRELNVWEIDKYTRATEHIIEQINMVKVLINKWYTYIIAGDWIYMDTSKIEDYWKLMWANYKKHIEWLISWFRVEDTWKKKPTDFALWKFSPSDNKREMEWIFDWPRAGELITNDIVSTLSTEEQINRGFPGWHIECSAMSIKYLWEQFDIHTWWADHINIHHTNEIAQSECCLWHTSVKYWMHEAFITMDGGKLSKSLGNSYIMKDFIERWFSPLDVRFFFLTAHYKTEMDFTWGNLEAVRTARINMIKKIKKQIEYNKLKYWNNDYKLKDDSDIVAPLLDDLNTPWMLAEINKTVNDLHQENLDLLYFLETKLLKVWLFDFSALENKASEEVPGNIKQLADDRVTAKQNKDYRLADELRDQIKSLWYEVKDGKDWYEIVKL